MEKSKMLFENNKVKKKRRKKRKKPRQFSVEIDTSMHFMYYNAQNALNTVQPKNNARARTSFCVRKKSTSCGFLRVGFTWFLQAARSSLRLEVKTARTSLRPDF